MARRSTDLLQGTLDMLVLKALTREPLHGYAVMRWLRQVSDDGLKIEEGALYPALHRLQARGWVAAEWGLSDTNRQAKYYALTAKGHGALDSETQAWRGYVTAVSKVLEAV